MLEFIGKIRQFFCNHDYKPTRFQPLNNPTVDYSAVYCRCDKCDKEQWCRYEKGVV